MHSSHGEGDGDPRLLPWGRSSKHLRPPEGRSAGRPRPAAVQGWDLHTPVSVTVTPLSGAGGRQNPSAATSEVPG